MCDTESFTTKTFPSSPTTTTPVLAVTMRFGPLYLYTYIIMNTFSIIRLLLITIVTITITSCSSSGSNIIPQPVAGDCYRANRTLHHAMTFSPSVLLDGKLISAGCIEYLKQVRLAREAGIDVEKVLDLNE